MFTYGGGLSEDCDQSQYVAPELLTDSDSNEPIEIDSYAEKPIETNSYDQIEPNITSQKRSDVDNRELPSSSTSDLIKYSLSISSYLKRKRNNKEYHSDEKYDQIMDDDLDKERFAKKSHCEIERRRRNKLTAYITELSEIIPICSTLTRRPDQLTVLRMAIAHIKNLKGAGNTNINKPMFLTDQEYLHLVHEADERFFFVISCDTGKIIDVSESVGSVIYHSQSAWLGSSIFDYLHHEDVEIVKEQLFTHELQNTVKKDGHQSSIRFCLRSRRRFLCRMKIGNFTAQATATKHTNRIKQRNSLGSTRDGDNFAMVHCTGYIKNWLPYGFCLVAIGRLQLTSAPNTSKLSRFNSNIVFVSRLAVDGKFMFVDQLMCSILGFIPSELLYKTCFEFIHPDDETHVKETFKEVLNKKGKYVAIQYRFRSKNRVWIWLRTSAFAFLNPYTENIEYVVCKNSLASKPGYSSSDGKVVDNMENQNQQPGSDFSVTTNTRPDVCSSNLIASAPQHIIGDQRPNNAHNVYNSDMNASPINYNSPCHQTQPQAPNNLNQMNKTSPSPSTQTNWPMRQQQPVGLTEDYQYNQLSLSQSPNGPTYTKLNAGSRQNVSSYHDAESINANLWGWQDDQTTESSVNSATPTSYPVSVPPISEVPELPELSDEVLQILDQKFPTLFEELNIEI